MLLSDSAGVRKDTDMSLIVPGCRLLLALLIGIAVDNICGRKPNSQRDIHSGPYNCPFR
jgi:hypothetical protein